MVSQVQEQRPGGEPGTDVAPILCLSRLLRFAEKVFRDQFQMKFDIMWDVRAELAKPYLADEDAETQRAWRIVDASLGKLQAITENEGTTLVVVQIADPFQVDKNWLRVSSAWMRQPLDPIHPNRRLGEICRRRGIHYYDMYPDVTRYIEEHDLHFPYLSFRCDRHYTPRGQELMANLVVGYLREQGLVPAITP